MQIFRSVAKSVKNLPKRQSWHNLSAYTLNNNDSTTWKELRSKDILVQATIDRNSKSTSQDEVEWTKWENSISHKNIVDCLKSFYDNQMKLIDSVLKENHTNFVKSLTNGWNLYEDAISSCEKSVEKSEFLLSNGARALWVSYNNPPIWKVDTNEWVDSDFYWQAYIEKHHFNNPNPISNDPELPNEIEAVKKTWHTKMGTFNDRSDIPMLYCYMDHLPSWEYYDIHRRAFLEHMSYYLIKTGGDYHFFPECPPWQWLTDIEELRYRYVSVAQRRRSHFQLTNLEREMPLDLQPVDSEHDGEEFHLKMIYRESRAYEFMVGRLMGNFLFLTHPFVPFQTLSGFNYVLNLDNGNGQIFSIGDDVNALFYLPNQYTLNINSPKSGFVNYLDHLAMTGRKLNPGYATLFEIFTDLLDQRGVNWFTASNETMADAFLRRIRKDDPSYPVYNSYVSELKERFSKLQSITKEDVYKKINDMEDLLTKENLIYEHLSFAFNSDLNSDYQIQRQSVQELNEDKNLQSLSNTGTISTSVNATMDPKNIMQNIVTIEEFQSQVMDYFKSVKLGNLEKIISKSSF